jgi:hypothetical protein
MESRPAQKQTVAQLAKKCHEYYGTSTPHVLKLSQIISEYLKNIFPDF